MAGAPGHYVKYRGLRGEQIVPEFQSAVMRYLRCVHGLHTSLLELGRTAKFEKFAFDSSVRSGPPKVHRSLRVRGSSRRSQSRLSCEWETGC